MCSANEHVRFTPDSDRESGHRQIVRSALPPKADMCSAQAHVCFGPKADIAPFIRSPRRRPKARPGGIAGRLRYLEMDDGFRTWSAPVPEDQLACRHARYGRCGTPAAVHGTGLGVTIVAANTRCTTGGRRSIDP